jgi:hypothetical protein
MKLLVGMLYSIELPWQSLPYMNYVLLMQFLLILGAYSVSSAVDMGVPFPEVRLQSVGSLLFSIQYQDCFMAFMHRGIIIVPLFLPCSVQPLVVDRTFIVVLYLAFVLCLISNINF